MPVKFLIPVISLCLLSCKRTMVALYTKKYNRFNERPFPRFPLVDVNGNTVPFDTLKGKVIYMDAWHTKCKPCFGEFQYIDSVKPYFKNNMNSLRFVFLCVRPPESHQAWLDKIKEHKVDGDNYYISDSTYNTYRKEIDQYFYQYPISYLLSPDLTIKGTDVEGYSTEMAAVYQISEYLKGTRPSKSFRHMARQAIRAEKGKQVSKDFKEWYKEVYNKDFDSLAATFEKK